MKVDPERLRQAVGAQSVRKVSALCMGDMDVAATALAGEGPVLIACGQQARLFAQLADEIADSNGTSAELVTVDIRDRAGWTADKTATAKQAALLAEGLLDHPSIPVKDVVSSGVCMIVGPSAVALAAAQDLCDTLAVTCLLTDLPDDILPDDRFDIAHGKLQTASGTLGNFTVVVDSYAPLIQAGRKTRFAAPKNGAKSGCDILLDLSGAPSLFAIPGKRHGYLRAAARDAVALQKVVFQASQMVGTFEKPIYVRYDHTLCAHSRAAQNGCTRCLDVCTTGAILPDGDGVRIDADVCAGCGACAAVCPSGAVSYDAPEVGFLFRRLRTLATTFRDAAAHRASPRVLFHDAEFGHELIQLSARFGQGLPADVIPVEVPSTEGVGHAECLAALGCGFSQVLILCGPKTDQSALAPQAELARAMVLGARQSEAQTDPQADPHIRLLTPTDPEALEIALYGTAPKAFDHAPILPVGGRRDVTRLAATAISGNSETVIPLPQGAPYGAVVIDKNSCTLCLSCVSLCPVGALGDNADRPEVTFTENACLQCGICQSACPENAISLIPQLDLNKSVLSARVLHTEEPFNCIECGRPFGIKSTVERVVEKLSGNHWMYTNSDNIKLIQMCDDCRIKAQFHSDSSPFKLGERPKMRTADDT